MTVLVVTVISFSTPYYPHQFLLNSCLYPKGITCPFSGLFIKIHNTKRTPSFIESVLETLDLIKFYLSSDFIVGTETQHVPLSFTYLRIQSFFFILKSRIQSDLYVFSYEVVVFLSSSVKFVVFLVNANLTRTLF